MNHATSRLLVALLLAAGLAACDVLDVEPTSDITDANFWNTPADAAAAVNGVYDGLQTSMLWMAAYGDVRTGEDLFSTVRGNIAGDLVPLIENNLSADVGFANWSRFYSAIARSNNVLANLAGVEALSEDLRAQYRGEALFARALNYFWLVRLWGDVPIVTEPFTSPEGDVNVPQSPRADVYALIERDATEAAGLLPATYPGDAMQGRATTAAAHALLADLFLWIGQVESDESALQRVIEQADAVISSGYYSLADTYRDVFWRENTAEALFELQYDYEQGETHGNNSAGVNSPATLTLTGEYSPSTRLVVSQPFLASVEAGDLRIEQVFVDLDTEDPKTIKYLGTPTGNPEQPLESHYDANLIVYRLADVLLMKAEALNELGRTSEAIPLLNQIRARAGLPETTATSQDDFRRALLQERRVEFYAEGKRFFDLVRNGLAVEVLDNLSTEEAIYWPVHEQVLIRNPSIEQNPYYQ